MQGNFSFFMMADMDKTGKFELRIPFEKEDLCKLLRYEQFLRTCVEKGYRPRPSVLNKFGELLKKSIIRDFEARERFFLSIKEGINKDVAGTEYDFNIQNLEDALSFLPPVPNTSVNRAAFQKRIVDYTFQGFLDSYFIKIVTDETFEQIISNRDRQKFVAHAFSELYHYLSKVPDDKQPSFYRYTVVVGYLAVGFGLIINEDEFDKSPSNHSCYTAYLNNITRHICKKTKDSKEGKIKTPTKVDPT